MTKVRPYLSKKTCKYLEKAKIFCESQIDHKYDLSEDQIIQAGLKCLLGEKIEIEENE